MAVKKNPWDDVINFDDWNNQVSEELKDEEPAESSVNSSSPKEIQGIGIVDDEDDVDISNMIANLNAGNSSYIEKAKEEEEQILEEKRLAQEEAIRKANEEKLREKYEAESAERDRIAFEEAQALAEAERLKQEKSIINKANKLLGLNKKPKKKKEKQVDEGSELDIEQNDTVTDESLQESEESANEKVELSVENTEDFQDFVKESTTISSESLNQENTDIEEKDDDNIEEKDEKSVPKKKSFWAFGKAKKVEKPDKKKSATLDKEETLDEKSDEEETSVSKPDWEYLATHDELTGLLNQRAYEEDKTKKRKKAYAVVYIDVNNLKYANDNFGHAAGNKLIVAVSNEMKNLFPECSYRIGGDEFVAIVEYSSVKKIEKDIEEKKTRFHEALDKYTKEENEYRLVYSASFGYAYSDGTKSFEDVSKEADKSMYSAKDAYKKSHPQFDMRNGSKNKPSKKKENETPKEYDELLSKEQRELKKTIQNNHRPVSVSSTQQIIMDVQSKASQVIAILIASPTFDQLFIIHDPNTFINIVMEMESVIDYSYLYILYEGGPQYKGSDEYLSEVTHIFESIGNGIKTGKIRTEKDIKKIKGINVFKKIFVDL